MVIYKLKDLSQLTTSTLYWFRFLQQHVNVYRSGVMSAHKISPFNSFLLFPHTIAILSIKDIPETVKFYIATNESDIL